MTTIEERMLRANWTADDLSTDDMPAVLREPLHATQDVVFYSEFKLGVEPTGRKQKERWYEVGHDGISVLTDTCDHYVYAPATSSPCWHMTRCQWHLNKRQSRTAREKLHSSASEQAQVTFNISLFRQQFNTAKNNAKDNEHDNVRTTG